MTPRPRPGRVAPHPLRRVLVVVALWGAAPWACPVARAVPPEVIAELESQAAILRGRGADLGIRGVLRLALEAAGVGYDPALVDDALFCARSMQDRSADSPHFGNFRWRLGDEAVGDENAVEFALQLTTLLALDHAAALSPQSRDRIALIHRDALAAIRRHRVAPGHTNVVLMRVWNLLALGRLGDASAGHEGRAAWDEWRAFTSRHGITESLCPTYYGVDLDALGLIASRAADATVRAEADAAIAYLWRSIAAHWYAPSQRLAGPHARDTDWLRGRGLLDEHLLAAGWIDAAASDGAAWLPGATHGQLDVFRAACRRPPAPDLRMLDHVPRFVVERCGDRSWSRSTTHLGARSSIGIAGATRGAEDKAFVAHLGGGAATVNVTLVVDGHGDPYGRRRAVGADGHRKARHLRPLLAASQQGPRVTALWHLDPADAAYRLAGDETGLAAHLVMPSDARVWCGGAIQAAGARFSAAATLFVEREGAVLALRALLPTAGAEDTAGNGTAAVAREPRGWQLVDDGTAWSARRLTVEHAGGSGAAGPLTVILDMELRDGLDAAAFAAFREEFASRERAVRRDGPRLKVEGGLPLAVDLVARRPIVCVPVLADGDLLIVDGVEVGRDLLGAAATP